MLGMLRSSRFEVCGKLLLAIDEQEHVASVHWFSMV